MNLKQPDPLVGLRQVVQGFLALQRKPILDLIRSKTITPTQLGHYVILVLSADWTTGGKRVGTLRHTQSDLAKIWGISGGSICENLAILEEKGLITRVGDIPKITDFDLFHEPTAKQMAKVKLSDEEIEKYFGNPAGSFGKSKGLQSENTPPFSIPFKIESNVSSNQLLTSEPELKKTWTMAEWEIARLDDPGLPSWENKLLIDEAVKETSIIKEDYEYNQISINAE